MTDAAFPNPGDLPVVDWISKNLIDVDHAYQRPEDAARAEKIARSFSWSKFGALVVVPKDGGRYAVIDGQHRAAAAKLHPLVDNLPAVIMPAVQGVVAEAASFIGLNGERKAVSGLELYHAKLAAGDEDAQTIDQVVQRAGVRIPKYPGDYKPRDTVAVAAIQAIIGRHGAMRARGRIEILAKAECAPITANQLKAVECLMCDPEFRGQVDGEDLTSVIVAMSASIDHEAKRFSETHRVPLWKAMASTWFSKCKRRRVPAKATGGSAGGSASPRPKGVPGGLAGLVRPEIAQRAAQVAMRTITPHRPPAASNVTAVTMGDPEPGRSALDRRRQG